MTRWLLLILLIVSPVLRAQITVEDMLAAGQL